MKNLRVFIDSNIILTGTFFSGPESMVLSSNFKLLTSDVCKEEVLEVVKRKFRKFGFGTEKLAVEELLKSFADIEILKANDYMHKLDISKKLLKGKNDQKILAAVLHSKPDYFVTGDSDFKTNEISKLAKVVSSRELLENVY
ncbi:MAG: putative toxin-antitoxin system toxin component, PIN family [Candidatus Aenigmarchaeota archaeon]|nr:putative toxin-antitoxin system toxin component, PIN family [Candidatus Aenigmarchaeota archaeon]